MRIVVGLGSNLDRPHWQLARAVRALSRLPRTRVVGLSPFYLTAPQGGTRAQPDYVNAVAVIESKLEPLALLDRMHAIERRQRRVRVTNERNAPRTIDLDLLLAGRRRSSGGRVALPHPRMQQRAFVLRPLVDVAPHVSVPGHGLARKLLRDVASQRAVRIRESRPVRR
ncbi:MAG TPA: 2-amino-4-hydroxy-6-hydroxymethyldihydropteridine diphosphokinase [Casimicrobiaceae bacterium]|nr:2-amino-4-hydroxy-6-hydroxymethyldihydropteridine diphosphokinase [Casimicrobiaceae bacterium]